MNKKISFIVSAVITAVLSTLCCVPALVFFVFGISASGLSFLIELDFLRIPFAILTFLLLLGVYKKEKDTVCNKEEKQKRTIINTLISLAILFILFYPELLNFFVE